MEDFQTLKPIYITKSPTLLTLHKLTAKTITVTYLNRQIRREEKKKNRTRNTYHVLIFMNGMGRHVKNTVMNRKNLRPHRSDKAPIRGALRKDNKPCQGRERLLKCFPMLLLLLLD